MKEKNNLSRGKIPAPSPQPPLDIKWSVLNKKIIINLLIA